MDDDDLIDATTDALARVQRNEPGARQELATTTLEWLRDRFGSVLGEDERRRLSEVAGIMRVDGLRSRMKARRVETPPRRDDHFPGIERRGLLRQIGLTICVVRSPGQEPFYTVGADVLDAVDGSPTEIVQEHEGVAGEAEDDAIRSAILDFFEHETDHGLWRDGKPIRDPHADDDPNSA